MRSLPPPGPTLWNRIQRVRFGTHLHPNSTLLALVTSSSSISADISLNQQASPARLTPTSAAHELLKEWPGDRTMSLVRLLGFRTLTCGCVVGRYRELATSREVSYVEEKGGDCDVHVHRRNHTIPERIAPSLHCRRLASRFLTRIRFAHEASRGTISVVPRIPNLIRA